MTRRQFVPALAAGAVPAIAQQQPAAASGTPEPPFTFRELPLAALPFPMAQVRLAEGPCKEAQEANRRYLHRLDAGRLVHNFKVNAGLPSSAAPLGGWEKPDCELRGHFTGHYLSACALMHASTGDAALKEKAELMVAELAKCQSALGGGYLSAFPREFWDRLKARKRVWAPFYTIHKIMAGMLDVHQLCGSRLALEVLEGMASWADQWSEPLSREHMQSVLDTEFGGMNEVLYNLAAATGNAHYAEVAHRFDHARIFDPLALRRDELKKLHVNTQVPKIIGAARRHELSRETRYHDIADFFWNEVTGARCYCTGGTSNGEHWSTDPRRLAEEWRRESTHEECCVAYNMMKLTRRLYSWTADPRYFDYYERTLFNHRIGTIHPETGGTSYFLSLTPGAWKTFGSENDSFWCCTGTGVEEYAKLSDSIFFRDAEGVFVNLFIASELSWAEKGIRIIQDTRFPEQEGTRLTIRAARPVRMTLRVRIPSWVSRGGAARLNGAAIPAFASPGSYLTLARTWRDGDRLEVDLPMSLRAEPMPDDGRIVAFLYGPLVLAGDLGPIPGEVFGHQDPDLKKHPLEVPPLKADSGNPGSWIRKTGPLAFQAAAGRDVRMIPFYKVLNQRYAVYWRMA